MKKIIYLGYVVDPKEASTASGASIAGNKMQWNILQNLDDGSGELDIECVTMTPYAAFPRDKMIFQKRKTEILGEKIKSTRVSYLNLPVIKQLWQISSVYRNAKKIMKKNPDATILCFNLFPQIGTPVRKLKKKFPNSSAVCILADLPIDDKTDRKGISKLLRRLFDKNTNKNMTSCDKYIVLNKKVAELYLPGKPYIVIDGGVDAEDINKSLSYEKKAPTEKNILFCGALTEYNGVLSLIEAMEHFRGTDILCDIYGGGYLEENVRKAAENNPNIRFYGRVDNATVMQKQREAWLLINPRLVNDPIAQVTFPSKTFEYLLSGTPILSTKLCAYTDEYKDIMFFTKADDFLGLIDGINRILSLDENRGQELASNAKKFVIEKRKWGIQAKRIYNFIFN